MNEQEKEFQMTINGLRLQVSLRNTEIVDLHRKNKILRDEIAHLKEERTYWINRAREGR